MPNHNEHSEQEAISRASDVMYFRSLLDDMHEAERRHLEDTSNINNQKAYDLAYGAVIEAYAGAVERANTAEWINQENSR